MSGMSFLIVFAVSVISIIEASTQVFPNAEGITNLATLSTGPFAVRTIETPSVANTDLGRNALRQRQTEFVGATAHGGVSSPSLFQTADGRVFALSNGRNAHRFAPGQIFQSADGRFFTIAAVSTTPSQQSSSVQGSSSAITSSVPPRGVSSTSQEAAAANEINNVRTQLPSTRNRLVASSVTSRPAPARTTTQSTPPIEVTTSSDIQPTSSSKSSIEVLTSFKNAFGKRTRPLTPSSTLPLAANQQRLKNQNSLSSFNLHKIARKNKSVSDSVITDINVQEQDSGELQQQRAAEIQKEQLIQQQIRLQIERQELQLKRLKQMQMELQERQDKRQKELLKRHREKQESLRIEQQQQLEALNQQQKLQLEQLQLQHVREQKLHLAEMKRQESTNALRSSSKILSPNTLIASAPLTPATSRFLAVPAVPEKQQARDGKSLPIGTQGLSDVTPTRNEIIQQITKPPKTQRVVTRIGARRRFNRLKGQQHSQENSKNINRANSLPSKIITQPTTTSSSTAVVSGYFTFPSSGVFYNF